MGNVEARQHGNTRIPPIKQNRDARAIVKHRGVIEKKIERFFHESEELGWDYDAFVASVLEILTVLHHRNSRR